jgi:diadenylate cyclase
MTTIIQYLNRYTGNIYIPEVTITDIVEIIILSFLIYQLVIWIKNTKAWMLLKGLLALAVFILIAAVFQMNTILWLVNNAISVLAVAAVVVFQPELRRALEKLGEKNFLYSVVPFDKSKIDERFSEETQEALIDAAFQMGAVKTGALIVVERAIRLYEYEATGIELDSLISAQLLINIFEHNTPLHDGAIIVRGDRVVSATCYLPLSENMSLSKELGTRHRAAVGISEISDSFTIAVSEETGYVSVAQEGQIIRNVSREQLRSMLDELRIRGKESSHLDKWRGWFGYEKKSDE